MKSIYVSARARFRIDDVHEIFNRLTSDGYEVAYDWTKSDVKIPYRPDEHRQHNLKVQEAMLRGAAAADVFVLLDDEGLRGAYIELGAFLLSCLDRPEGRQAFVVGPESHKRQSIFESPSLVHFVDDIEDVYKSLEASD